MDAENVSVAFSALGTVLSGAAAVAGALAVRWQTRFARGVALDTTRAQGTVQRAVHLDARRSEAWTAFLRAADAFTDAVRTLADIAAEQRADVLRARSEALTEACSPLRVLGPERVARHAESIRARCSQVERYAVQRAVVRRALRALEAGWCPGNAEHCRSDAHTCAWLAHDLLESWADREDDDRSADLDFLEYLIKESNTLPDPDLALVLSVARSPVCWELLIAGEWWWEPRTGIPQEREAFAAAVGEYWEQAAGRCSGAILLRGDRSGS